MPFLRSVGIRSALIPILTTPPHGKWALNPFHNAFRPHSGMDSKSVDIPEQVIRSEEPLERYQPGGYHPVNIGDKLNGDRYTILRKLGWGQYSTVWLAMDSVLERHVAIKILTDKAGRGNTKLPELDIHLRVQQSALEHPARAHILTMLRHFEHVGPNGVHVCMLFDVQGVTVEHLRRRYLRGPMPLSCVKQITKQILVALDFLHVSCGIIHTDVKPDNILVCPPGNADNLIRKQLENTQPRVHHLGHASVHLPRALVESQPLPLHFDCAELGTTSLTVKLADLGVCNWVDNHLVETIQSPGLRAPEVLLGAHWGTSVDIWGFACVIYALLNARVLFNPAPSEDPRLTAEEDHIVQIVTLLGSFPPDLIRQGKHSHKFFDMETGSLGRICIPAHLMTSLEEVATTWAPRTLSAEDVNGFVDFLQPMLRMRPADRPTAKELLGHTWLQHVD